MRLTNSELDIIIKVLTKYFGEDSIITLFGSRVDDSSKGGDIDLLIEHNENEKEQLKLKLMAISEMQIKLGDRKIDLITHSNSDVNDTRAIFSEAKKTGIILWKK
ncbi:nucleotidyltransferase domain-containing protein [Thiospirochaeta perfilievii]|uniref:Nucleotidyltransferase domain-containing protein n=1 Tax=Thiospirochaeta perfilievii TaxID=252967 RepID=A0A5C1QC48_9SPIO|nr:nucleotidyltransferase domain-containing protein [Thiospirochaeta perfilievii]QEN05663.1 nucleotidyltransferase domain-containing protein [Thiospirochaeta perfilievii]